MLLKRIAAPPPGLLQFQCLFKSNLTTSTPVMYKFHTSRDLNSHIGNRGLVEDQTARINEGNRLVRSKTRIRGRTQQPRTVAHSMSSAIARNDHYGGLRHAKQLRKHHQAIGGKTTTRKRHSPGSTRKATRTRSLGCKFRQSACSYKEERQEKVNKGPTS